MLENAFDSGAVLSNLLVGSFAYFYDIVSSPFLDKGTAKVYVGINFGTSYPGDNIKGCSMI